MRRRRAIAILAGALSGSIAGCSSGAGDDRSGPEAERTTGPERRTTGRTPTRTQTPTAATPPSSVSPPGAYREAYAAFLADEGIATRALRVEDADRTVVLRYVSRKTGYEEIGAQIGTIAGGFFRQVDRGWAMARLEATMLDPGETPVATWQARTAWFREFDRGEIPAEELSLRILDTLEPVEGSSS